MYIRSGPAPHGLCAARAVHGAVTSRPEVHAGQGELQREHEATRAKLEEASAEARALADREQVLLHRINLREKLVDWSHSKASAGGEGLSEGRASAIVGRSTDIIAELRAAASQSASQASSPVKGGAASPVALAR